MRTEVEGGVYYGLPWQGWRLAGRLSAGYIFGWGGDDVRINDRFFKGGSSFRGFDVAGIGPVKLRLRSPRIGNASWQTRERHLRQMVDERQARLVLELRRLRSSPLTRRWQSLAEVRLTEPAEIDQQALRFSPFRVSAGMQPIGFVHAIRVAAYAASQDARPSHG